MRGKVVAAVGYTSSLVGKLQRSNQYLALTYTERAYSDGAPTCLAIQAGKSLGTRDTACYLVGYIALKTLRKAKTDHKVTPMVIRAAEGYIAAAIAVLL